MWSSAALAPQGQADEICIFDPIDDAYDAWKAADAAARVIEREVQETWQRYERGVGAGPSRGLLREVACLRLEARDRLRHAIRLLHEAGYIQPVPGAKRVRATSVV
ncbi:hypothetical protein [Ramlibacter sp. AN1133]|uniref:hypothetical protein n=1 Tax=Ramlibacter sp. AN1133 TaxID=3133429 RepID=UPI0030C04A16